MSLANSSHSSILCPLEPKEGVLFGVSLAKPDSIVAFYQEHLYSLFLLLYLYGQDCHRETAVTKIKGLIQIHLKKIQLHQNKGCGRCERNINGGQEGCKEQQVGEVKIKLLKFLERELLKNRSFKKLQLHGESEKECIKKACIVMLQQQNEIPVQGDLNYFSFAKLACLPLGLQFRVRNYYHTCLVDFGCPQFFQRHLSVFIEIDLKTQTYYYVKQKVILDGGDDRSEQLRAPRMDGNGSFINQARNMGNSSFWYLLKVQNSIEIDQRELKKLNETLNEKSMEMAAESESKFFQENESRLEDQNLFEQSQVLQNISKIPPAFQRKKQKEDENGKEQKNSVKATFENSNEEDKFEKCESICSEPFNEERGREQSSSYSQVEAIHIEKSGLIVEKEFNEQRYLQSELLDGLEEHLGTKSTCIIPAEKERGRRNSDTLNQKMVFPEFECAIEPFPENGNRNTIVIKESHELQRQIEDYMLESQTFPFKQFHEEVRQERRTERMLSSSRSNTKQLISLVLEGGVDFSETVMDKFTLEDVVDAIEELENRDKVQRTELDSDTKEVNAMIILSEVFRQQKQHRIADSIEKALTKLRRLKERIDGNQTVQKRGRELVKYEFNSGEFNKKQKELKIIANKLNGKGLANSNYLKVEGKGEPSLSRSRVLSISKYEASLETKYVKYFGASRR